MKLINIFRRKTKVKIKIETLDSYDEMIKVIKNIQKIEKEHNCVCTLFFDN